MPESGRSVFTDYWAGTVTFASKTFLQKKTPPLGRDCIVMTNH